mmetsp:Transcript_8640/g.15842  ORF Transcript_8640/g.15842 Transcript_8640/m.15842 type:complete len:353 (-) Transcript_8640:6-1064(-)
MTTLTFLSLATLIKVTKTKACPPRGKKRPIADAPVEGEVETTAEVPGNTMKKKKRRKKKPVVLEEAGMAGCEAFSPEVLSNLFMSLYRKEFQGKVVPAELTHGAQLQACDTVPPSTGLRNTGDPAKQPFLDVLPGHLASCLASSQKFAVVGQKAAVSADKTSAAAAKTLAPVSRGSSGPRCIVVSSGALRCCALVPSLRRLSKRLQRQEEDAGLAKKAPQKPVLKLFAKHQKVCEQAAELRREQPLVVVGTPNRLLKLLEEGRELNSGAGSDKSGGSGALSLEGCELVVLDAFFKDAKNCTLLTLPGVTGDLMQLFRHHILKALESNSDGDVEQQQGPGAGSPKQKLRVAFV